MELFEAEVPRFVNKVGDYEGWTEYQKGRFDVDTFMKSTKSRDFDGHKLWDKGMAIRRGIVGWIAKYGDILKFNKSRGLDEEEPGTVGNLLLDSGVVVDDMLQRLRLNEYRDFLKVIDVDGNAEVEDEEAALDDLPETFFTLEFLALKYLVIKCPEDKRDAFMTALISTGSTTTSLTIPKKSRAALRAEGRLNGDAKVRSAYDRQTTAAQLEAEFVIAQTSYAIEISATKGKVSMFPLMGPESQEKVKAEMNENSNRFKETKANYLAAKAAIAAAGSLSYVKNEALISSSSSSSYGTSIMPAKKNFSMRPRR